MLRSILVTLTAAAAALLAWSAPAQAFNFGGCGNFELISFNSLLFDSGDAATIDGDILVINPSGFVKIGAKRTFTGAIFANAIFVGTGSTVAKCIANTVTGPGTCLQTLTPFVAPPGCTLQPFPPGIVVPQIPAVCLPGTAILVTSDQSLPSGCYASIRVGLGKTLTLEGGGFYLVKGEFRTLAGGTVESDTPGTRATIAARNVFGDIATHWTDLFVFQLSAQFGVLQIFNNAVLDNTVVLAPTSGIHMHTGGVLKNDSALAGFQLDVEPVATQRDVPPPVVCECPPGFKFAIPLCIAGITCSAARECVPN